MSVSIAYLAVLLIWSTTPLGIVWSSESISPSFAVLLRMVIAVILGILVVKARRIDLPWHRKALTLYTYSAIGIFGGMMFSYLAATYLSSGIISLVFGFSPIISAVLAKYILTEPKISLMRKLSMVISIIGLAIVCSDNFNLADNGIYGVVFILCAVFFFSLSGVLVKSVTLAIHPLATTVGALSIATPMFLITWLILDGTLPIEQWQAKSLWATLYLGVFGSLIGFYAYFTVLQKLSASNVTLITLITPIIALTLGAILNDETINDKLILGAFLVLLGLSLYHFGHRLSVIKTNATKAKLNVK
ncbi:DMT family transporter [Colwellia sp. E2M01]|uniref:DMT family transporter n=1 Tax=Colwellia sp. E2M01 TaxID=2841561 RepID=UPI001C08E4E2|nr:DMT family transporter [Colwellia sp. E2M01]MBU2870565.1 DMT family transporter [Colwellia sp. E2M01]